MLIFEPFRKYDWKTKRKKIGWRHWLHYPSKSLIYIEDKIDFDNTTLDKSAIIERAEKNKSKGLRQLALRLT